MSLKSRARRRRIEAARKNATAALPTAPDPTSVISTPIVEPTRTPEMKEIRAVLNDYLEHPNPNPPATPRTTYAAGLGIKKALIEAAASAPK